MDRVTTIVDALEAKSVMESEIMAAVLRFYARTGFTVLLVNVNDRRAILAARGQDGPAFEVSTTVDLCR